MQGRFSHSALPRPRTSRTSDGSQPAAGRSVLMKPPVFVLMCVAALIGTSAMADPPSYTLNKGPPFRYDFQLEKGAGAPVCEAYLKRLRNTDFYRIPHCDRPENTSVPG